MPKWITISIEKPNSRPATIVAAAARKLLTDSGSFSLSIPRDRQGHFEPQLIEKYRRRFPGFDEKVIAMYARGMTTRDIQAHVLELYGIEISPDLVSTVP